MNRFCSRRNFLLYSGGVFAGAMTGCVQNGSEPSFRLALKVLGVELLALEVTVGESSIDYSYMTAGLSPEIVAGTAAISPRDLELLHTRPVAVVSKSGAPLGDSMLSRSRPPFRLANREWAEVEYRCPAIRQQVIPNDRLPRVSAVLRYLKVDTEFEPGSRSGQTLVTYGDQREWESLHVGGREVAKNWRKELRAAGFETA